MKINIGRIQGLSRAQKILLSLFKLSGGEQKQIRYEDIVVEVFSNFPSDFQLRGYPQYPDTGDIIHKPLYSELKKSGYVLSGNKYFWLTAKGVEYCRQLLDKGSQSDKKTVQAKLSAVQLKEIERIKNSTAFSLYSKNKKEEILDIDFYSYLGVSVLTRKNDFLGRMRTVEDAISSVEDKSGTLYALLNGLHQYLLRQFEHNITLFLKSKGR